MRQQVQNSAESLEDIEINIQPQKQRDAEQNSMSTSGHSAEDSKMATEEFSLLQAIKKILANDDEDRDPYTLIFKDAKMEREF